MWVNGHHSLSNTGDKSSGVAPCFEQEIVGDLVGGLEAGSCNPCPAFSPYLKYTKVRTELYEVFKV